MGLVSLNDRVVACDACPRLRSWCSLVAREKRRAYAEEIYWGRPVPHFGDPKADRLIVGLAPAAHGANRTGRMFTGDRSGQWLFRALHAAGVANQPSFERADDGLRLDGALITAVCHCAPPGNAPLRDEIVACRHHLEALLALRRWRSVLCLGGIAWSETCRALGAQPRPKFAHGATSEVGASQIFASYHPSQQNTFTGRLTESMLEDVVTRWAAWPG